MKITSVKLYVFPLENLHCGKGVQQGALLPSLAHIPGRVVRGGLAGWAVRNGRVAEGSNLLKELFYEQESDNFISYPWCTCKERLPAPFSIFHAGKKNSSPREALLGSATTGFINKACDIRSIEQQDQPADFLLRESLPAESGLILKPFKGTVDNLGFECFPPFPTIMEMKAAHNELGRVSDTDGLRVEEMIPAAGHPHSANYYCGTLNFLENDEIQDIFEPLWDHSQALPDTADLADPTPVNLVFLGRKRVWAAIFAEEPYTSDFEESGFSDRHCTVTLTTDCIFSYDTSYTMNRDLLAQELGLGETALDRAFCSGNFLYGFDTTIGKPAVWPALAAGSCASFQLPESLRADQNSYLEKLWGRSLLGLGKHGKDGCGRLKLNWSLHDIN